MTREQTVDLEEFGYLCDQASHWPLPGGGETRRRLALLAAGAEADLVLGRLVEAHADAVAILTELDGATEIEAGQRWGVWAAGPANALRAVRSQSGWRVEGEKHWCSGATLLTDALVDAATADGQRLFAVSLAAPGVVAGPVSWTGAGMARSDTRSVAFAGAAVTPVGRPDEYLTRPGFWAGAVGVAACWHGGTVRVAQTLLEAGRACDDAHLLSHLGATHAALFENQSVLAAAAAELDGGGGAAVLARSVRAVVERNAVEVMDRVGRALGPRPLAHDAGHAQAVADLTVYIRQHHAERDLERLGRDIRQGDPEWSGIARLVQR